MLKLRVHQILAIKPLLRLLMVMESRSHDSSREKPLAPVSREAARTGQPSLEMLVFCCILTLAGIATVNRITVHASHIRWTPCPSTYPASLECGRLAVPVDYNHPNRAQISLGMVRLRASTPRALGNLIVNPGGPGNSAVSVLARQKQRQLVSRNLTLHYNIIAPDPRGVGASHPVRCDADLASRRVPGYITGIDDFDKLAAWSETLGKSCARMTGPVFYHLDTISAARDLDRIRRVSRCFFSGLGSALTAGNRLLVMRS